MGLAMQKASIDSPGATLTRCSWMFAAEHTAVIGYGVML
jgi:hypothetical protein